MSAASSEQTIETPSTDNSSTLDTEELQSERKALKEQVGVSDSELPIIAVDLDDVLSQTNREVAAWHNEIYGTDMQVSDFYYYYYWKNPYWGSIRETFDKVKIFYASQRIYQAIPVPGALEGTRKLKALGYRLVIVTARNQDEKDQSWQWVNRHFPDTFHSIICTGQFTSAHKEARRTLTKSDVEVVTKLSKAEVCSNINAQVLIDDSSENAIQVSTAANPTPVLLFGDYEWNQRISGPEDAHPGTVFETRLKASDGKEFWREETVDVPEGAPVHRVRDWHTTVEWVKRARADSLL